ncbi:MAG: CcmD family protein [Ferruginibacter sp.]
MRNKANRFILMLAAVITGTNLYAQSGEGVESTMRSNGKIYVVLAICVTILVGLFLYLVSIDRKIGKIEDRQ